MERRKTQAVPLYLPIDYRYEVLFDLRTKHVIWKSEIIEIAFICLGFIKENEYVPIRFRTIFTSRSRTIQPCRRAFRQYACRKVLKSAEYVEVGRFNHSGFVAEEEVDGGTGEVPVAADFVLEVTSVWFLYPLGEVAEEYERRNLSALEHGDIFDFNVFALVGWGRIGGDVFLKDAVEFGSRDGALAVLIDVDGGFNHLLDALFGEGGAEDDGEVDEGGEAFADCVLESLD